MEWPCPLWSALKRKPMQDFNSFSIMFYYIFSTKHQKNWRHIYSCYISWFSHSLKNVSKMHHFKIWKLWHYFDFIHQILLGFFIFCSSVSVSSNSSEELRQQIRRHKATRPPIEEEEPEKTNQDSQDSVHSMYSFSNRILNRLSLSKCFENLLLLEKK